MYFEAIPPEDWSQLTIVVMRGPSRCLHEWRAAGTRIIATVLERRLLPERRGRSRMAQITRDRTALHAAALNGWVFFPAGKHRRHPDEGPKTSA